MNRKKIAIAAGALVIALTGCGSVSEKGSATEVVGTDIQEVQEVQEVQEAESDAELKDAEAVYMDALGRYVRNQLGLDEYEKKIEEIGGIPVDAEYQSEHQIKGSMGLKYIYIRNDLHIERLSDEDIQLLNRSLDDTEDETADLVMEMVIRTFPACITPIEIKSEEDKDVQTIYDEYFTEQDEPRFVSVDSLVLNIATQSDYDETGEITDEEKDEEKEAELIKLAGQMEGDMEGLLGETPVRVFVDPVE